MVQPVNEQVLLCFIIFFTIAWQILDRCDLLFGGFFPCSFSSNLALRRANNLVASNTASVWKNLLHKVQDAELGGWTGCFCSHLAGD